MTSNNLQISENNFPSKAKFGQIMYIDACPIFGFGGKLFPGVCKSFVAITKILTIILFIFAGINFFKLIPANILQSSTFVLYMIANDVQIGLWINNNINFIIDKIFFVFKHNITYIIFFLFFDGIY